MTFRNFFTHRKYLSHLQWLKKNKSPDYCFLCDQEKQLLVKEFTHWKVIKNNFPYGKVATTHDLISPKRHVLITDLNPEELAELLIIKTTFCIEEKYDMLTENFPIYQSIKQYYHAHLLKLKEKYR